MENEENENLTPEAVRDLQLSIRYVFINYPVERLKANLLRFPENDSPVSYGMITDTDQFTVWVAPLLN